MVHKYLLARDKFLPEMYSKQPGFTYSTCGPFTTCKGRIQKFKETGDSRYIYKNERDKGSFQHDMTYGDFKYLAKRTASEKVFNQAMQNMMDIKKVSFLWFIIFLIKNCFISR